MIADCDSPVLNKPSITVSSSTFSASLLDELSVTIGSGFTPFGAVAERSDTNGPESSSSSLIEIALALGATAGTAGWIDDNEVAPEAFDIYKPRRVSATMASNEVRWHTHGSQFLLSVLLTLGNHLFHVLDLLLLLHKCCGRPDARGRRSQG